MIHINKWGVAEEQKLKDFYIKYYKDYETFTTSGKPQFKVKAFCNDFMLVTDITANYEWLKKKVENIHSGKYEFNV